ncbi:succinyldiaminopimelate transaminase [Pseudonocardia sp. KRD-184]|uniref:Succinyldiaminopimelate transaminase n=1 Tax=Pseudonocardia oceani TaxID=2792013 RepID=A0ABS6UBX1_9PSEU|nr:succinyldiaminopimelate transaminase [Pseudonocardia oceani]MBW0091400.1 succinyldiaminopimelate transaminase [Pseudonocardia oceani]MBW0099955.1 succinyldiaminopimelate transaminase [Pseudonocardia oceani]MBW0112615.1 succinyldiaminopimelate transaminase [Pseudonocardia oceani]MBW0124690.1 succinyldiaminopimelate transaminase [Pseudonocardia oceani]MBW0129736.1 succinyldiaminopimelate transaminase [Pseudonocardia oceani]
MIGLPDFPWDSLAGDRALAEAHPDGIVDLSVGTPVDPIAPAVRAALSGPAADDPGYPTTHGPTTLRVAVAGSLARRFGVTVEPVAVLPTIGSKELVAWLPTLLGLGSGDTVVIPELAYPTYEVGARIAGATAVRSDGLTALGPARVGLLWVNSPSNPTGKVLPPEHLRKVVAWARERGAVVASDECYLSLSDGATSILHPDVCGGSHEGLLAVHSMSKSSGLAGYRAGFVTGDPSLVAGLLEVRKHAGMIVPRPVQAAMEAAASDDAHVAAQAAVYAARRARLRVALEKAGLRVDHSEAGLYLWATAGEPGRTTVRAFAEQGVLVAPGEFYGPAGAQHVRVALTAADERIDAAVVRLSP